MATKSVSRPRYLKAPPPPGTGRYDRQAPPEHVKVVQALMRRPGEWMEAFTYRHRQNAGRMAVKIKRSELLAFRQGHFDAVTRGSTVYVVYLGER